MREPRMLRRAVDVEAVSVRLADDSERASIERLSQFYIYDFSEWNRHAPTRWSLANRGLFAASGD
jgi:hypothetical protein